MESENKIAPKKTRLIRVDESTAKLLEGFGKSSMDASIRFLWDRVCEQTAEIKEWRTATSSKSPLSHLKKHAQQQSRVESNES